MKKSVLCVIVILLISAVFVFGRSLLDDQKDIIKIQTNNCRIGATKCFMNSFQECDGSIFVTKKVCTPTEVCTLSKGCISRSSITRATASTDFYAMRLTECKEGHFECLGRFVKICRNHVWQQEFCQRDYVCHPEKGCIPKKFMTRFKERDLNIPTVPKVPLLHYN